RNCIRTPAALEKLILLTPVERAGLEKTAALFRLGVTPYYLSLVDPNHPFCPVRMQAIPVVDEARARPGELVDPLGEDSRRPVAAIIHKYPDRVLLLALDSCPVSCPPLPPPAHYQGRRGRAQPNRAALGDRIHPVPSRDSRRAGVRWGSPAVI